MLAISLSLSLVLLGTANYCAVRRPPRDTLFWCTNLLCSGVLLCSTLHPLMSLIQVFAFGIAWSAWRINSTNPRSFLILSLIAAVATYVHPTWHFLERNHEHNRLREEYPIESLEHRLPPAKPTPPTESLPSGTLDRLTEVEEILDVQRNYRTWSLERLHARNVNDFISQSGFGVGRMARAEPNDRNLKPREENEQLVPQPSSPGDPSSLFQSPLTLRPFGDRHLGLHRSSVTDFVYADGFGYQPARKQAAGFRSHHFHTAPDLSVRRIELVSVLRHDTPVAYVTDHLPAMAEAANAPTRPLDEFETNALTSLRKGDDLIVGEGTAGMRMLGAIRLAKQCAACHDGNRGDLLGAFTYVLKPAN